MSAAKIIRLVLTLVAGLAAAFFFWRHEVEQSQRAVALLDTGKTITASVTNAAIKSKKKYGFTTSKSGEINYEFALENGQSYSGKSDVDAAFIDKISDPADDTALLDDASVEVAYLADNPSVNGVVEELTKHREVQYLWVLGMFAIAAVVTFMVLTRLMGMVGMLKPAGQEA